MKYEHYVWMNKELSLLQVGWIGSCIKIKLVMDHLIYEQARTKHVNGFERFNL